MIKQIIKKLFSIVQFLAPLFSKKSKLDSNKARELLENYSPKPIGEVLVKNNLIEPTVDLQIIVPAYNVEQYLADCLDSIISQQTQYTYMAVVIDDGSTDGTPAIADKYSNNEKIIVIHQPNKGFSGARNTGLKNLFGKYIMFVDSDDMLCPGAIEALLKTAFENDCDIVEGGMFSLKNNVQQPLYSYPQKKILSTALGTLHGFVAAKTFKADCFENLAYPEGFWFEDSIFSFLIYPVKTRICVIDEFIYIYRANPNGISSTHKGKPKSIDTYWITEKLMQTQDTLNIPVNKAYLEKYLRQLILNQKRIAKLPEPIQESAFVLSADMMHQYFPDDIKIAGKYKRLAHALSVKDWGKFRFYCKF